MVLEECLAVLKAGLPSIVRTGRARIQKEYDENAEEGASIGAHLEYLLEEGVTTRFLTAATILAVWALYEAAVAELAQYVREQQKLSLRLRDIRGGFLDQARRYFADVLKVPLHPAAADWSRLSRIGQLRNVLAHTNGTLRDLSDQRRKDVESLVKSIPGVAIVNDEYLVVSIGTAENALAFVKLILSDLVDRVRKAY